ncbi:MAG: sulfotransferase [Phycisphaerales bacterium]|nr:sulfotransferase [Phycisphaerales bacterium]
MPITQQEKLQRIQSALRMEAAQNHDGAIRVYQELIARDPGDPGLHYHIAMARLARLDREGASVAIRDAIRLKADVPEFYAVQATIFRSLNRLDDALKAVRRGLEFAPDNLSLLQTAADLYNIRGDIAEGIALLEPHRLRAKDQPQFLVVLAQLYLSNDQPLEARAALERAISIPGITGHPAAWAHLHMGSVAEKLNDYQTAWKHYTEGNRHRGTVFNPDQHDAIIGEAIRLWSTERLAKMPRAKNRKAEQLVFIVGMPRSGTSLVEQILASHPEVYGGGELNFVAQAGAELFRPTLKAPTLDESMAAVRQPALDRESQKAQKLMTEPAPRAKRFTDKLPQNFLHLGLIELLFPEARVIHCMRDPRDVCLSCYTKLFGGANSQPFSGDLTHLGRYHRAYERIMEHWYQVSKLPILPAVYEEGVQDLESFARRLVDFVGLEWHDACLRFWETKRDVVTASTDQVRRPIYTSSIGRWKRFESHLGPLFDALGMPADAPWPA